MQKGEAIQGRVLLDSWLTTGTGTYGNYGAYKRDAAPEAAPVDKREPEAEPKAEPEAKPQYGELCPKRTFYEMTFVDSTRRLWYLYRPPNSADNRLTSL